MIGVYCDHHHDHGEIAPIDASAILRAIIAHPVTSLCAVMAAAALVMANSY